jgi:hypothetical protein
MFPENCKKIKFSRLTSFRQLIEMGFDTNSNQKIIITPLTFA